MSVGPGELALVAGVAIVVGLSGWGWRDSTARGAARWWRVLASVPVLGTLLWLRVGRARHRRPGEALR